MGSDLQNLNNLVLIYFFLLGVGLDVESFKKLINLIVLNFPFKTQFLIFVRQHIQIIQVIQVLQV